MRLPVLKHKEVYTMAEFFLKNDELAVKISSRGAEIRSVLDNETGREYMWQADANTCGRQIRLSGDGLHRSSSRS